MAGNPLSFETKRSLQSQLDVNQTLTNSALQSDSTMDVLKWNHDTISLVDRLKGKVQEVNKNKSYEINEELIEDLTSYIKFKKTFDRTDIDQLRRYLPEDLKSCPDNILKLSMAYGDNPNEVKNVIQAKLNNSQSTSNSKIPEKNNETSIANIIEPLKQLKKSLQTVTPYQLCETVLNIKNNEYERADRMFFSEASQLMCSSEDYTVEHAHDQVEAIRVANYILDDGENLLKLIKCKRTFDEAYAFLQDRVKEKRNRISSATGRAPSAIVRASGNDGSDSSPPTPSSPSSYTVRSSSASARPPTPKSGGNIGTNYKYP